MRKQCPSCLSNKGISPLHRWGLLMRDKDDDVCPPFLPPNNSGNIIQGSPSFTLTALTECTTQSSKHSSDHNCLSALWVVKSLVWQWVSLSLNVHYYHSLSASLFPVDAPLRRSSITHTASTSYTISLEFSAWVGIKQRHTWQGKGRHRGSFESPPGLLGPFQQAAKCLKVPFSPVFFFGYLPNWHRRPSFCF